MQTVLGLDLGTQSLKALFYDAKARSTVAVVSSPLEVDRDGEGKAEQHAQWWLRALADCMDQVDPEIRQSVQSIAVSGQQHGFVPLDGKGEVIAPVKLWCDTATQKEVEEINAACGGPDKALSLTGNPVLSGYTSPKIRWLKNNHPSVYQQLRHILLPHDYLNYILTGNMAMEYGDASGTGLLDVRTRSFSAAMLNAVDGERDLGCCLPSLVEADQIIGRTTVAAAESYGLPVGIPVATGGGDNMMGAIGTGNVVAGKLTISLGSSGTLYAYSDKPIIDPEGLIAAFCSSSGGWQPLLCTMNCTLATDLMRQPLDVSLADFDRVASQAPAGADGLITLPFFNGERTPDLPDASASVFGLNSHNCSKQHLLRSAIEGTCYALKNGLEGLTRLGLNAEEIVLTGGGSKSQLWRQIIADSFRLPVVMHKGAEGACFGAALQALWAMQLQQGGDMSLEQICNEHLIVDHERCVMPDAENAELHGVGYQKYLSILQQVTPLLKNQY